MAKTFNTLRFTFEKITAGFTSKFLFRLKI